mgnify:CR=1 FL=1
MAGKELDGGDKRVVSQGGDSLLGALEDVGDDRPVEEVVGARMVVVEDVGVVDLISFEDGPGLSAESVCLRAGDLKIRRVGGVDIISIENVVADVKAGVGGVD